jgi:hypothetical protein
MLEREFIGQFTSEYTTLLNNLCIAEKYKDSLEEQKKLIFDSYTKVLKPLCESYLSIHLPDMVLSTKTELGMQQTTSEMFTWLHWLLKDSDLVRATTRLLHTLIKAV